MTAPRFKRLDKVEKSSGYRFPGVVIGVTEKLNGLFIYDVEAEHPDFRGMVHIFSEHQLMPRDDARLLSLPIGQWPGEGTRWRHTIRGTFYKVIGRGRDADSCAVIVLYQDEANGTVWSRRWEDFVHGNFERVT